QLDSVADVPNAVDDGPVALVSSLREPPAGGRTGQRIFAAEIRGQGKADRPPRHDTVVADVPLVPRRVGIPESRQRIGRRALPAVTEPLGEREVPTVVVRPALQQLKIHGAPLRKRTVTHVPEGI